MNEEFPYWIRAQADERGWSLREVAKRAKISTGALNQVLGQGYGAGPSFCISISKAFGIPPEDVFRLAGILPQIQREEWEEMQGYFTILPKEDLYILLRMAKNMAMEHSIHDEETEEDDSSAGDTGDDDASQ